MADYQYPIDNCDVSNRAKLEEYRRKRSEWIEQFQTDENSVSSQLHTMLWHCAVFHTVNESRRLAHESGGRSAAHNGMLAEFIDHGFVAIQSLSVRKLLEKAATKPDRQVVSLRRLLDDLRDHRALMTREMYVCHDALPYDYEPAKERHRQDVMSRIAAQGGGPVWSTNPSSGPEGFDMSEHKHKEFDQLSGTVPAMRSRHDVICQSVFDRLDEILNGCGFEDFKLFADKVIAHAGDAYSRTLAEDARSRFTLDNLGKCQKAIYEVADFVGGSLIHGSAVGGFPVPQFDQLENLDAAWCSKGRLQGLRDHWNNYVSEVDRWRAFRTEELLA